MLLVERFFTRLFKKIESMKNQQVLSNHEMQRIMSAEAKLVHDFTKPPPTVSVLARQAHMSETKFKLIFKRVYGCNPYEYYQKNRMIKAKNLLVTGKFSVKEVGLTLNFKNLSNFSVAFRKEFNFLPSEILKD